MSRLTIIVDHFTNNSSVFISVSSQITNVYALQSSFTINLLIPGDISHHVVGALVAGDVISHHGFLYGQHTQDDHAYSSQSFGLRI